MKSFFKSLLLIGMILITCEAYAITSLTYQYDANGNLTSGDGKYYEYNDANQLVKVRQGDQSGPVIAEYLYEYTGQRIKKIENGVTTYYIGKHYEEVRDGVDVKKTNYYFANGERVAKKDPSGNMYYYHSDHLGGTNVVTNASGTLVERIKYYPFGEIREGGNEKYSFTSKEKDKLTDNYYFEARYYNPDFKHFTQADTVAPNIYDPQNLNRYAYVRNNPVKFVDPIGNVWWNPFTWLNKETQTQAASSPPKTYSNLSTAPLPGSYSWTKLTEEASKSYSSNVDNSDKSRTLSNAEKNLGKYRTDQRYAQYKDNCKFFMNEVHEDETGRPLPSMFIDAKKGIYNYYATEDINTVTTGDYIQRYGDLPHTAKVLAVDKVRGTITVLDANYQGKGISPDIRIRYDRPMEEFSDYKVYGE